MKYYKIVNGMNLFRAKIVCQMSVPGNLPIKRESQISLTALHGRARLLNWQTAVRVQTFQVFDLDHVRVAILATFALLFIHNCSYF